MLEYRTGIQIKNMYNKVHHGENLGVKWLCFILLYVAYVPPSISIGDFCLSQQGGQDFSHEKKNIFSDATCIAWTITNLSFPQAKKNILYLKNKIIWWWEHDLWCRSKTWSHVSYPLKIKSFFYFCPLNSCKVLFQPAGKCLSLLFPSQINQMQDSPPVFVSVMMLRQFV